MRAYMMFLLLDLLGSFFLSLEEEIREAFTLM